MRFASTLFCTGATAAALALPAAAAGPAPWTLQSAIGNPENVSLSGSFRARFEALDGQYRPGLDAGDNFVSLRTTLAAEYRDAWFKIGGELFDSRVYFDDRNSAVSTSEVNTFELVHAYFGANLGDVFGAGSHVSVTGGRFTLDLGSRRLIARNDYRNTTNAFTGLHVDWRGSRHEQWTLFYTFPQVRLPADKTSILANHTEFDQEGTALRFWGAHVATPKLAQETLAELYFYGLNEDDSPGRPTRNRTLYTPGTRFYRAPQISAWDYELEGAYQFGDVRSTTSTAAPRVDVAAYFVHVQIGKTFRTIWNPRIAIAYDGDSGDHARSSDNNRFDTLFGARRFDFGPTGLYGPLARTNLSSPELRVEVKPDTRWDGLLAYRAAWLESSTDSFSNTGVRDAAGRAGDFAGHQIETRARYWLVPKQIRLEAGGAVLLDARFLKQASNATQHGNTVYGYCSVSTMF